MISDSIQEKIFGAVAVMADRQEVTYTCTAPME